MLRESLPGMSRQAFALVSGRSILESGSSSLPEVMDAYFSAPRVYFSALLEERRLLRGVRPALLIDGCGKIFSEASDAGCGNHRAQYLYKLSSVLPRYG